MPICGAGEVEIFEQSSIVIEAEEGVDNVAEVSHNAESIM